MHTAEQNSHFDWGLHYPERPRCPGPLERSFLLLPGLLGIFRFLLHLEMNIRHLWRGSCATERLEHLDNFALGLCDSPDPRRWWHPEKLPWLRQDLECPAPRSETELGQEETVTLHSFLLWWSTTRHASDCALLIDLPCRVDTFWRYASEQGTGKHERLLEDMVSRWHNKDQNEWYTVLVGGFIVVSVADPQWPVLIFSRKVGNHQSV